MPYRRFRKTLYKKVGGKWTKKRTFPSTHKAKKEMDRLNDIEAKKRSRK